ncbi:MAG TPA: AAA family ATPase [Ktedonobacteraceae bacterium]|nr:AAA family ATPase [Ktedonobacteraceae bacterium]
MNVEVRNLGVIREAKIDVKPLTVLVGPNNAGKTWLAYTFAGVLGQYGQRNYSQALVNGEVHDEYPPLTDAIQQVLSEGNAKIDLVRFVEEWGERYVNNVAKRAKSWMRQFMRTGLVSFDNLEIYIRLEELQEEAKAKILHYALNRSIGVGQGKREALLNLLKEAGKPDLYLYTSTEVDISVKLPPPAIESLVMVNVMNILARVFFADKRIFPTERTTYITSPFSNRELNRQSRITNERPLNEQGMGVLSVPVSLFVSMIESAFSMTLLEKEEREKAAQNNEQIRRYIQLAQILEQQILQGNIDFSTPEPGPTSIQRDILFQPTHGITLEIPLASSMVKELSSLVLYLRYLAEPGDWLVIDEPEMNLHPEAQVQITELLAMLVHAGLRVLITTHSPYIVDHLANLMKAAENEDQEAISDQFYLKSTAAFIPAKQVSAYLIDKGEARNILEPEGIIDWRTFSKVSDRVMQIYFEL